MSGRVIVVLVTGSNLGRREDNLARAREEIGDRCGDVTAASGIYRSAPWGEVAGQDGGPAGEFLNQALVVETELEPLELLDAVKGIEADMGRKETGTETQETERQYFSRTIDIDIIFYGEVVIDTPRLKIPHPLAARRRFVLEPVAEIVPRWTDPVSGLTVERLLERLGGK